MTDKKNFPAVSIVVPMYNVEKYIGECLDSVLAQTFTDYELLVVDDCSTDKSCEIVESYIPKFDGRLNLIKSEKNSGGCPGIPRNIGIDAARGEYIMFVDSDDVITPTALEGLYPIAKKFNADLLQCQKYYQAYGETVTTDKKYLVEIPEMRAEILRKPLRHEPNFVKKPTLISKNLAERVEDLGFYKVFHFPWNRLFRRELIVKNNIKFPPFRAGEDLYFHFFVFCLAENIVDVPNVFYVWRQREKSACRQNDLSMEESLNYWTDNTLYGIPLADKFMDRFEFFRKNAEYKYLVFEMIIYYSLLSILPLYENIPDVKLGGFMPSAQADKILRPLMDKVEDKTTLLTVFFNRMNFFQVERAKYGTEAYFLRQDVKKLQEQIADLQNQIKELQR